MFLHEASPKTEAQFLARLTENERIMIRGASEASLESMRHTHFSSDMVSDETIKAAAATLKLQYAEFSKGPWWKTQTWNK